MGKSTHWHILIIDDNPDDRDDFRKMLIAGSGRTCHFSWAALGDAGLQMILDNQAQSLAGTAAPFDCVLLDFNLPDLSATQLLTTLCGPSGLPPFPVVVMTGWDGVDASDGPNLLKAGAQDYIGKSWTSPPSLCRAIENSMDRFKLLQTNDLAARALAKSEESYRTLFNSIDEGYCVIEMMFDAQDRPVNFRYLKVNQSFERQTGLTGALGKTILQLMPDIEKRWIQTYGKVAQTGNPVRIEDYVQSKTHWFEVYAFRIDDPEKKLVGVLFNNITERKVAVDKLHGALAAADAANRAKSEFLSSMSHELRTPLNSILGFAQLLEAGKPQPTAEQQSRIDMILRGGWYLLTLIDEVLDLASIESGKVALKLEAVSVARVLADCESMIEPEIQRSGIRVDFPVLSKSSLVVADPIRLKQVVFNLLSNAIKYNRSNGTVKVNVSAEAPHKLRISVQDTGHGLPAESLSQLFQPFNRLGQETGNTSGTGIGLVVTKRLVELMGGHVGVSSVVGEGSVFWVELSSASDVELVNYSGPSMTRECLTLAEREKPVCTVLYVEDNLANLDLVTQILSDIPNIELLHAPSGREGIAIARRYKPHVILMDISLSDISGLEAFKILQMDSTTQHIPVVAVSANAMPLDIVHGLEVGFFSYITKPFRVQEFLNVLDLALAFASKPAMAVPK
jgi:PAS domain S-box-containing protein